MNNYRVVRVVSCPTNMMLVDFPITDINVAYTVCEGYNKYFCHSNCGCQFRVEEADNLWLTGDINGYNQPYINLDPIITQPITTQPIWIVNNDYNTAGYNLPITTWTTSNIPSTTIPVNTSTTSTIANAAATALPYIYKNYI